MRSQPACSYLRGALVKLLLAGNVQSAELLVIVAGSTFDGD